MTQPRALAAGPPLGHYDLGPDLWGFGGVHGGLAVALLARAMHAYVPAATLRSITAHFDRPLRGPFDITTHPTHQGRTTTALTATATSAAPGSVAPGSASAAATSSVAGMSSVAVHVRATATFSASPSPAATSKAPPVVGLSMSSSGARPLLPPVGVAVAPVMPRVPPPEDCPVFTVPVELAPFGQHTEIRPVGPDRPFAGGATPELTAWLRFAGDHTPPDVLGLVVLMDALAPSYAAVLTAPVPIPTVQLTVRPVGTATSPWVLLRARTRAVVDCWVDEEINAWSPEGVYLGSASQLRVVRSAGGWGR